MIQIRPVKIILILFIFYSVIGCNSNKNNDHKSDSAIASLSQKEKTNVSVEVLTDDEIDSLLNAGVTDNLNLKGYVETIYKYSDKSGERLLVLTKTENNKSIHAYCAKKKSIDTELLWSLNDFSNDNEYGIFFMHDLIDLKDYDNDKLIDPILVYGSKGDEGFEDGRVKIIIRYKDKKIAIRHQNSTFDDERVTTIDDEYKNLPPDIKNFVKEVINKLISKKYSLFNSNTLNTLDVSP